MDNHIYDYSESQNPFNQHPWILSTNFPGISSLLSSILSNFQGSISLHSLSVCIYIFLWRCFQCPLISIWPHVFIYHFLFSLYFVISLFHLCLFDHWLDFIEGFFLREIRFLFKFYFVLRGKLTILSSFETVVFLHIHIHQYLAKICLYF